MNTVDFLLENKFSRLKIEEKLEVRRLGPYQPKGIKVERLDGKIKRKFNANNFNQYSWLTVSDANKKFYCFYCLIFDGGSVFSGGYEDLKHLAERLKKHQATRTHIECSLKYELFGKNNISEQISDGYKLSKSRHNENVTKNRYIIEKIINILKFIGAHELSLRGHDESDSSANRGVFKDLVDYTSQFDAALHEHLQTSNVAKHTSKTTQNEILDCMYEVIKYFNF